jgi:radical SAM/Cys-rich protein
MNDFEKRIAQHGHKGLYSRKIDILQVNLGLKCNQECLHCHLEASPGRLEMMGWDVMEWALKATKNGGCRLVDLTGGAPELHPDFRRFVKALREQNRLVQVRTNLTVLLEDGLEDLPEFFREQTVHLVASLPCYLEENVSSQRGPGVYEKSITAIRRLNSLGYGIKPSLPLNLVYNPGGPSPPASQTLLEEDFRRELGNRFGIVFSRLFTITNMALGRFRKELDRQNEGDLYGRLLQESFNPETLPGLMCRHQLSVGWDGTLHDCDFNLALRLPVNHGAPDHIRFFESAALQERRIVTGEHCFGCTASTGSSCTGAILCKADT